VIVILLHALSLATTPLLSFGPFKIFVLSQSIQFGWRQTLRLALTPLVADIPVILLVWLVLRQLPENVINILSISGGLFYFYLALVLFRTVRKMAISDEQIASAPSRTFWQAAAAIWISPQVYINWTIIGVPALLIYSKDSIWYGLAFLFFFYLLWIGGLSLEIIIFGQASSISEKATKYLVIVGSLLLIAFGIYQIWLGINGLVT
jgi:threonine/homoserine/homoserine lactone efflux protein